MIAWFNKAAEELNDLSKGPKKEVSRNDQIQGSYTDHHMHPLKVRQQLSPMHGDELDAFNWVIEKMEKLAPDNAKYLDLVDLGMDQQWFYVGSQGELRVSQETPE